MQHLFRFRSLALGLIATGTLGCGEGLTKPETAPAQRVVQPQIVTGWIMYEGRPLRVTGRVEDGHVLHEGDINLGPVKNLPKTEAELHRRTGDARFSVFTNSSSYRWVNGEVPYVIDGQFSSVFPIINAFAQIANNAGGIRFIPKQSYHSDWISIRVTTATDRCGDSYVGRQGGMQIVNIRDTSGCLTTGVIAHELMHAIGFQHMQSRCDRDTYVTILSDSIQSGYSGFFDKKCNGHIDIEAYDEGSVMHYDARAFGLINSSGFQALTIKSKRGRDAEFGQRVGLSTNDAYSLIRAYAPYAPLVTSLSNSNGYPSLSVQWPGGLGAINSISLVKEYTFNDDYSGTSTSTVIETTPVNSNAGSSVTDNLHPWTGQSQCFISQSYYGSELYTWYYEFRTSYPNGVYSGVFRTHAPIASC